MPSRMKLFFYLIILTGAMAIFANFFCPSPMPRIANTQSTKVHYPVQDPGIFEEVFRYPDVFLRNYALMEKGFKIFIYQKDVLNSFYSEYLPQGTTFEEFFSLRLNLSERFYTNNDTEAHMFFIPLTWFEIGRMGNYSNAEHNYAENYVRRIINEYSYWNRSKGFDHFLITCCDDGAIFSERVPQNNSIQVSCQARNDSKHITIPQMRQPFFRPMRGNDIHHRTTFAFWACHKNSRASKSVFEKFADHKKFMASKYCICDGASYITRICITDSIHYGCVPVILYEGYELPFGDILDWTKFSITINKDDADRVEQILETISDSKFSELHNNILEVQRHFYMDVQGQKPYDAFHLIMYELWLRHFAWSF